ncbi:MULTISPECIES: Abi family protein [Hafnia]|uniref:Abi family protein n=1 Tax=Hafnia TaxID=568 RepID=UPI00061D28BB|nr:MULTISPECIES: Abi family protein [Hafnia]KKF38513.1 DNA-binding protein [Hafnia alvei]MBW3478352.1 Abi family protein [Hafnia alvei]MCE9871073.1 Abi family protein [Hafnia alvei]MDX6842986.1 Abi family protein [Hafnia paralvei]PNK70590.1 DNA-binding protein [Hafnia paralvei]
MPTTLYSKPYRTPADLVSDLKHKKLEFLDETEAENTLSQISYYHFKIYLHPLLDPASPNGKNYRKDEYFEYGLELYRFDEKLRVLLFGVIARLEVKLRSRLDHSLSAYSNNPFWYLDDNYFFTKYGTGKIDSWRAKIQADFSNERELYARNYHNKYHNNIHAQFADLPPFWIASEVITIGCLLKILESIDFSHFKKLAAPVNDTLTNLAKEFGAKDFNVLTNWVQRLRDVRNRCAHHSRVWNAKLAAPSQIARELSTQETHKYRPYLSICVMHKMIRSLDLHGIDLKSELLRLFNDSHAAQLYMADTGFPQGWEADPFWD